MEVVPILLFTLARILFLKGCGSLFWKSLNSTKMFNRLQHISCVARIHKCFKILFLDSLFILGTKRKEDFKINSTFTSDS
jgi:hypothetical protein